LCKCLDDTFCVNQQAKEAVRVAEFGQQLGFGQELEFGQQLQFGQELQFGQQCSLGNNLSLFTGFKSLNTVDRNQTHK
jgi:hypothetical protein